MTIPANAFPVSEIRHRLADRVELEGGQRALARKLGIPQPLISKILSDENEPIPDSVPNALGYFVHRVCTPGRKGMNQ